MTNKKYYEIYIDYEDHQFYIPYLRSLKYNNKNKLFYVIYEDYLKYINLSR